MFAYDSPEEISVREHSTAVNTLISSNETVVWFSNKLVEKKLIHEQGKNNIVTLGISDYDKTDRLMNAVKAKIQEDPHNFDKFIAILEDSTAFEFLVEQLRQTCKAGKIKQSKCKIYVWTRAVVLVLLRLVKKIVPAVGALLFVLSCIVLTWPHVQDYTWNVLTTDRNVHNLWDIPTPMIFEVQPRREELQSIRLKFHTLRDQCSAQQTVVVYIVGPPAYGKSQLSRSFAEDYFEANVQPFFGSLVVAAVVATDEFSLYQSYKILAERLKLSEALRDLTRLSGSYQLSEGLHILARSIAEDLKKRQPGWLLIFDNLTSEVKRNVNGQYKYQEPITMGSCKYCWLLSKPHR